MEQLEDQPEVGDADWFVVKLNPNKSYDLRIVTDLIGTSPTYVRGDYVLDEDGEILLFPNIIRHHISGEYVIVQNWQGLTNAQLKTAGRNGVIRDAPSLVRISADEDGYYHFGVMGASESDTGLYVLQIRQRGSRRRSAGGAGSRVVRLYLS